MSKKINWTETPATLDEALTHKQKEEFNHKAFSIAKIDKKFKIIQIDLNLNTLQSKATMLEFQYDYEYQVQYKIAQLIADNKKEGK